jgi:Mn2+/Fe2+ NRAMP family transporter
MSALGPGLITGASDDDPSGIATYSQAGAQFGYSILWTALFTYPLMVSIQAVSARIGRVTGNGLADNIRRHYPKPLLHFVIWLVVIANIINLAADIGAMGEAMKLIIGGPALVYAVMFTAISLWLQIQIPYDRYVHILKWLTIVLFTYVAVVFFVHVPWKDAFLGTVLPSISWNGAYLTTLVAVLGTTISPYLFFWQSSQESQDVKSAPDKHPLRRSPQEAPEALYRIKLDTILGMAFSNLVSFFIILAAAVTLNAKGITNIRTAAEAAGALRPIAGELTFLLFSLGIIGTGMLALPVLAGATAYAVSETFRWQMGLDKKAGQAKKFYGVLAASTILGMLINFTPINPIKALFWSAVLNGVVAVPLMITIMLMSGNKKVMGRFTLTTRLKIGGWLATAAMTAAAVGLFATW